MCVDTFIDAVAILRILNSVVFCGATLSYSVVFQHKAELFIYTGHTQKNGAVSIE